jgi:hypothetical protein
MMRSPITAFVLYGSGLLFIGAAVMIAIKNWAVVTVRLVFVAGVTLMLIGARAGARGEGFLIVWIGATIPIANPNGNIAPTTMHSLGPLPLEVCYRAKAALDEAENVVQVIATFDHTKKTVLERK